MNPTSILMKDPMTSLMATLRTAGVAIALLSTGQAWAQPSLTVSSGTTAVQDMNASLSRGFSMSQAVGSHWSVDLDLLSARATRDRGVVMHQASTQTLGAGVRYLAFGAESHAIRPWAGAGLSWQTSALRADEEDAAGSAYHLWDDGLLYGTPQPVPMPDIERPSPLSRDNVFETTLERSSGMAMPLRAGVDVQLTRRLHATLAVTAIPGAGANWRTAQAGLGFQLGRGKTYLKTLFPKDFLALGEDADGDGVKDVKDLCGGTEPGAIVDKNGCAVDSDADGVPDHRDLEPNSPDMLVNEHGQTISLAEWKALYAPAKGDPSTFAQDSAVVISELTAAQMAQMLETVGNTAAQTEQKMLHDLREKVYNPGVTYRVQYGAYLTAFAPSTDMYGSDRVEAVAGEEGLTVHVGKEHERLSAARAALATAKSQSHSDAFVTAYHNGVRISLEEAAALESIRQESVQKVAETFHVAVITYHVQLGRYTDGVPVEVLNAFLNMGHIEQRLAEDGTHRYLTAGVAAEETARQHLLSARNDGFEDAFLVAEIDGQKVSVAQARAASAQPQADHTLTAAK